jgi:hypothetical protein
MSGEAVLDYGITRWYHNKRTPLPLLSRPVDWQGQQQQHIALFSDALMYVGKASSFFMANINAGVFGKDYVTPKRNDGAILWTIRDSCNKF